MWTDWVRVYKYTKSKASTREKLLHCQRAKTWWTWRVISVIAENKPHAHHKTHLHGMKVYNTRAVSLTIEFCSCITILPFFDHWSIHLVQSNQSVQAIEFVDGPVPEKLDIFCIYNFLSFLPKLCGAHTRKKKKKRNNCIFSLAAKGSEANN